jgi:O-6-methylguanine DNA methyltransferase
MDRLDSTRRALFAPATPAGLPRRLRRGRRAAPADLAAVADRLVVSATARGVSRIAYGRGAAVVAPAGRRHAARARAELAQYLAGRRTFFTVPIDLAGVGPFQAAVLAAAARIPYGEVASYAALAARVGHPRAARAVGNALGANPVPILLPCHRVVRGDGTWGHYAFGAALKTRLLALERTTPVLVGCAATRIVCRAGCAHERRIAEGGRVVFASVGDATGVGYRACRTCRPDARLPA